MITSTSNSRVKRVVLLQEKSRERAKENVFIAEGIKMFKEAPAEIIKELYIEESLLAGTEDKMLSEKIESCRRAGSLVETVTQEVLRKMSDTQTPQGVLCVMKRLSYDTENLVQKALERKKQGHAPLFLLLEDIQDPGNLGTMIRTAEGAGADGIFMTKETVDIYNPKTIRSTMGSLYRVPFVRADDLKEVMALLQENGITVYAAHLKGEKYYHEIDYSGGSAFLIGNEGNGLKTETADLADCYLKIPMEGKLESLNAAIAAALLMYQSRL
ncbi:MAG: TrmH family RNA methyltransferase [Suilimivivens sp.]